MALQSVNDQSFDQSVLKSDKPVLVDFWAEWCGPCLRVAPVLEELSGEMAEKVTIAKMNVDENPMVPTQFGIRSIPTMILFKNGKEAARVSGAAPKSQLKAWLESQL